MLVMCIQGGYNNRALAKRREIAGTPKTVVTACVITQV